MLKAMAMLSLGLVLLAGCGDKVTNKAVDTKNEMEQKAKAEADRISNSFKDRVDVNKQ